MREVLPPPAADSMAVMRFSEKENLRRRTFCAHAPRITLPPHQWWPTSLSLLPVYPVNNSLCFDLHSRCGGGGGSGVLTRKIVYII